MSTRMELVFHWTKDAYESLLPLSFGGVFTLFFCSISNTFSSVLYLVELFYLMEGGDYFF